MTEFATEFVIDGDRVTSRGYNIERIGQELALQTMRALMKRTREKLTRRAHWPIQGVIDPRYGRRSGLSFHTATRAIRDGAVGHLGNPLPYVNAVEYGAEYRHWTRPPGNYIMTLMNQESAKMLQRDSRQVVSDISRKMQYGLH